MTKVVKNMKLNHETVRNLLLFVEEQDTPGVNLEKLDTFSKNYNYESSEVYYTINRLNEANYINAKIKNYYGGGIDIEIESITWNGHKFLDTIRDNKVWSKTKSIVSGFSSVSLSLIENVASNVITQLITQSLNSS